MSRYTREELEQELKEARTELGVLKNAQRKSTPNHQIFESRAGQQVNDGKVTYPDYITVELDDWHAWEIVKSMINQLSNQGRDYPVRFMIAGKLSKLEEED